MTYKVTVKQDKGYEERSKKSTENDEEMIDEEKALDIIFEIMSLERKYLRQRNESLEKMNYSLLATLLLITLINIIALAVKITIG